MKVRFIGIFVFLFTTISFAQEVFHPSSCKKCKGIILDSSSTLDASFGTFKGRFIPTLIEINVAEYLLSKHISGYKQHYKRYNRQYLGLINNNSEKVIFVNLLNFNVKRRKERNAYFGWEKEWVIGFGEFFEENTNYFRVNLSTFHIE